MGKIFAVSTNKGGILKTTSTINIASVLSLEGYKVLIIDTDNQGNVLLSFGRQPDTLENTTYNVLVGECEPEEAIINNVEENIDVMPSNDDMAFLDFEVLPNGDRYKRPFHLLKRPLEQIRNQYDYIIVDTPPNLGLTHANVLTAVDEILIPFQPEVYSMRSLVKMLDSIKDFKEHHNPELSLMGVFATLVDRRTTLHEDILDQAEEYCNKNDITFFETVIPRTIAYASSIAYNGQPLALRRSRKEKLNLKGKSFRERKEIKKEKKELGEAYQLLVKEILN